MSADVRGLTFVTVVLALVMFSGCQQGPAGPTGPSPSSIPAATSEAVISPTVVPTQSPTVAAPVVRDMSPGELQSKLEGGENPFMLNVLGYDIPQIPGTDLAIPLQRLEGHPKLPARKDEHIVVYCQAGVTSRTGTDILQQMGYTNITNLDGGLDAWDREFAGTEWASR